MQVPPGEGGTPDALPARAAGPAGGERLGSAIRENASGDSNMLWTLAVILFVLWILGFAVFHVAGGLIHLLLVIAVIVIIFRLITGRRPVV
jgi:hypothetical protein